MVGLAVLGLQAGSDLPAFSAARQLLFDFLAEVRDGAPSPEADAKACATLARLPAQEIRRIAQELWNRKAK